MRFEAGRYEPVLDGAAIAADLLVAHPLAPRPQRSTISPRFPGLDDLE